MKWWALTMEEGYKARHTGCPLKAAKGREVGCLHRMPEDFCCPHLHLNPVSFWTSGFQTCKKITLA
jgi:hypothetical protein